MGVYIKSSIPKFRDFTILNTYLKLRADTGLQVPLYSSSGSEPSDIIAWYKWYPGVNAAVPTTIDLRKIVSGDESDLGLVDLDGGSAYSWSSGLLITDDTRLEFGMMGSLARDKVRELSITARIASVTLGGALGGTSRPRWLVGFTSAADCQGGGVAYDGTNYEAGNEYGDKTSPLLQSVTTVPGFAAGLNGALIMRDSPRQADTSTNYNTGSKMEVAASIYTLFQATTLDTTVFVWPALKFYISCWDSDGSTNPGMLITHLDISLLEI